jgi:hypothetical protein
MPSSRSTCKLVNPVFVSELLCAVCLAMLIGCRSSPPIPSFPIPDGPPDPGPFTTCYGDTTGCHCETFDEAGIDQPQAGESAVAGCDEDVVQPSGVCCQALNVDFCTCGFDSCMADETPVTSGDCRAVATIIGMQEAPGEDIRCCDMGTYCTCEALNGTESLDCGQNPMLENCTDTFKPMGYCCLHTDDAYCACSGYPCNQGEQEVSDCKQASADAHGSTPNVPPGGGDKPSGATACGAKYLAHESEECDGNVLCGSALVCATPISCSIDCVDRCSPTPCGSDADCQSAFGDLCDGVVWRCEQYIDTYGCTVEDA